MTLLTKKISMLVLGLHSKDRMSTKNKANIRNPKVNRDCPPLTANRISANCVQISLGPPMQYIPLRVYRTGGFNAMIAQPYITGKYFDFIRYPKLPNRYQQKCNASRTRQTGVKLRWGYWTIFAALLFITFLFSELSIDGLANAYHIHMWQVYGASIH